MIGVVRWTVAAFMANPDASDDELVEMLEAAGIPHAAEAVRFLPLAYGRQILEGLVELPDTFVELDAAGATHETKLADEPLYVAARELARSADRSVIERIGLTSSEVNAVNQALHHGSKPEDLMMSPPHMPALPRRGGTLPDAQPLVDELVRRHGAALSLQARQFPGSVKPGAVQMQLDVVAEVGEREINESFAGFGATVKEAVEQAVQKFARASLHVMLATLVDEKHGEDQVQWETCGAFRVCSGAMMRMWSQEPAIDYAALIDALLAKLASATLSPELHWVRLFVAVDAGQIIGLDALLDNHAWEPAVELAQTWPWPHGERAYALRHFMTLIPKG